jgi:hypothetical protein
MGNLGSSAALMIGLACAVGCSATTSSRNIRTAGMVALIDVRSEAEGLSVVEVDLVIGGANSNTYVVLEGGDSFEAATAGQTKTMQATSNGEYEAKFGVSEGEFVVSLKRDEDQSAPESRGTLPPPFTITSSFTRPILRSEPVTVSWEPASTGTSMSIELRGDCIIRESFQVAGDPGTFTIKPGAFRVWKSKEDQSCDVTVTLTRTSLGTTDPALDSDSRFRLHQVRATRFVSAPVPKPETAPESQDQS